MNLNPEHVEVLIGFGLFFLSEALSLSPRTRSNGVLQLLLNAARRAYPYEPRKPESLLGNLLDRQEKRGRR